MIRVADPDLLPGGQPADHEQPKLIGVGQVKLGRVGQPVVEDGERLRRDAKPAVFDLDGKAAGRQPGGDRDARARRRVIRGVLNQLGEQVGHVGHRAAGHEVVGVGDQVDSGIVPRPVS